MIYIDAKIVIETRIAESMGFDKYKQIIDIFQKTDVSSDPDFQRTFNAFYRVRRNEERRKAYYDLFEKAKGSSPSFEFQRINNQNAFRCSVCPERFVA